MAYEAQSGCLKSQINQFKQMFRITRVRIRWIGSNQHNSDGVLATPPAQPTDSTLSPQQWTFNPQNWRVRVKWVGFGPITQELGTPETPKIRRGGHWVGRAGVLGILVLLLGVFVLTRIPHRNPVARTSEVTTIGQAGLVTITEQVNVGGEPIQITHSLLDIGQLPNIFDNNLDTLIRGRAANPFILDFEFSQPQPIKGFSMDFGRMDFFIRVQVSGSESSQPILYQGEYRQQPDIPHIELNFDKGPEQVKRIHIEIEQINPPAEVHIHVREVVFKK